MSDVAECRKCGVRIAQQDEKALSGEVQAVWADLTRGEWICPADGEEHEPGTYWQGGFIVVEGSPVGGFVFHGIPAFHTNEDAIEWAEGNCEAEWWVAPLQDVES